MNETADVALVQSIIANIQLAPIRNFSHASLNKNVLYDFLKLYVWVQNSK